eukprot:scaffold1407_cov155-Skeletonema_dohrnii-CCMP3373.AAC.1
MVYSCRNPCPKSCLPTYGVEKNVERDILAVSGCSGAECRVRWAVIHKYCDCDCDIRLLSLASIRFRRNRAICLSSKRHARWELLTRGTCCFAIAYCWGGEDNSVPPQSNGDAREKFAAYLIYSG